VAEYLVAGIAPTSDTAQLEQMLAKASLDSARLAIITKAKSEAKFREGHHGGGSLSSSSTIMTGSGGTGVPGVGGGNASLSSFAGHGAVADYLGGLPMISPDQANNYNIAIAEGRALVTYKAMPEEAPTIETAFREAGLRNVKTFRPKETIPSA
jgi:hypothetical protein